MKEIVECKIENIDNLICAEAIYPIVKINHSSDANKSEISVSDAMEIEKEQAPSGDETPQKQYEIGRQYDRGDGVPQDYGKAVEWYTKAAKQGHKDAQYNLAAIYHNGNGVQKNFSQAAEWFRKAADDVNLSTSIEIFVEI